MTNTALKCGNLELIPATESAAHWLQFVTSIEEKAPHRWFIYAGENFCIELSICFHDLSDRNDMMNLWKRHGFIKETAPTHICIDTYYTDCNNNCWGYYNITHKRHESKIDFDWLLPWTAGNAAQLIAECIRMSEMDIR